MNQTTSAKRLAVALSIAALCLVPILGLACESGHWVKSVQADGKIVILEGGSVWEIDDSDVADTATWVPMSEIVVCDDKLINTDDDETVEATRIR
jgi:mRNA degradation ribonuclease J1/J2